MERTSHAMVQTVPAHHLRVVLDTAAEEGARVAELCEAVGLDARLLDDMTPRVPLEMASDTYDEAARRTRDGAFGLHVAERSDYFAFDALGLAVSTKRNLREAVEQLGPAITALHGTRMELDVVGDLAHLAISLPEEHAPVPTSDRGVHGARRENDRACHGLTASPSSGHVSISKARQRGRARTRVRVTARLRDLGSATKATSG